MRRAARSVGISLIVAVVAGCDPGGGPSESPEGPCERWVAPPPEGSDAEAGSESRPWATLRYAASAIPDRGCTVWLKRGVYRGSQVVTRRLSSPATFKAVERYRAVLEGGDTVLRVIAARNVAFEGFELRHAGPGASPLVAEVRGAEGSLAEDVVLRDNIIHDSWNNDLLKVFGGARHIRIEGNVFYNQSGPDEHIDVNGATDVEIQDNVFFNDFEGSGRTDRSDTGSFVVLKDSEGPGEGPGGSTRVALRRNVFLNWQGRPSSCFLLAGEDGKPFYEAREVVIENNLMLGNSGRLLRAALGVQGARELVFRNNTVVGDLPARAYAFSLIRVGANPPNDRVGFFNNLWADPTGSMGSDGGRGSNQFSDGRPAEAIDAVLENNLYWNGGAAIPAGESLSPLRDDPAPVVADPDLEGDHALLLLPRWTGSTFASGATSIHDEFERIVRRYAALHAGSPAIDRGDPKTAATEDILGRRRAGLPDLGAYEFP